MRFKVRYDPSKGLEKEIQRILSKHPGSRVVEIRDTVEGHFIVLQKPQRRISLELLVDKLIEKGILSSREEIEIEE